LRRGIKKSKDADDVYSALNSAIYNMVLLGYDPESMKKWNIAFFFRVFVFISNNMKTKQGAKLKSPHPKNFR